MSLAVVNDVSSTSPDSGYFCGGQKIRIIKFLLKKFIFQLVSTTKHPTNTKKSTYQPNKPKRKGPDHKIEP
jgi:hypothetical protein